MRSRLLLLILALILLTTTIQAKRIAPPKVEPVSYKGVTYTAPNTDGRVAYVVAYDERTGLRLWKKVIFENEIDPKMEADVQWCFIESLQIQDGKLIVTDEASNKYEMNLKTQEVKRLPLRDHK